MQRSEIACEEGGYGAQGAYARVAPGASFLKKIAWGAVGKHIGPKGSLLELRMPPTILLTGQEQMVQLWSHEVDGRLQLCRSLVTRPRKPAPQCCASTLSQPCMWVQAETFRHEGRGGGLAFGPPERLFAGRGG